MAPEPEVLRIPITGTSWSCIAPGQRPRAICGRRIIDRHKTSALESSRDRVQRMGLPKNISGIILRVLCRPISDPFRSAVVPITPGVVRDSPDSQVFDLRRLNAAHHELDEVVVTEPRGQMPKLRRSLQGAADPDRDALDSVLVPVHPGHPLAPCFA